MPHHLRNMKGCSTLEFKNALDSFLANIPNEPRLPGHEKFCPAETNSLVDMLAAYKEGLARAEEILVDDHVGRWEDLMNCDKVDKVSKLESGKKPATAVLQIRIYDLARPSFALNSCFGMSFVYNSSNLYKIFSKIILDPRHKPVDFDVK